MTNTANQNDSQRNGKNQQTPTQKDLDQQKQNPNHQKQSDQQKQSPSEKNRQSGNMTDY